MNESKRSNGFSVYSENEEEDDDDDENTLLSIVNVQCSEKV